MRAKETIQEKIASRHQYEKPLFDEQTELTFPQELLEASNDGRMCFQCSSCHGCR